MGKTVGLAIKTEVIEEPKIGEVTEVIEEPKETKQKNKKAEEAKSSAK